MDKAKLLHIRQRVAQFGLEGIAGIAVVFAQFAVDGIDAGLVHIRAPVFVKAQVLNAVLLVDGNGTGGEALIRQIMATAQPE